MVDPQIPSWLLYGSVVFGESVEESSDHYFLGQFWILESAQALAEVWISTEYSRAGRYDEHGRWVLTVGAQAVHWPGVAVLGG